MKFEYPKKFRPLLEKLELGFSPYDELNEEQEVELIEAVENYFSLYGIDESGDEESDAGTLCADFLTWIAGEGI